MGKIKFKYTSFPSTGLPVIFPFCLFEDYDYLFANHLLHAEQAMNNTQIKAVFAKAWRVQRATVNNVFYYYSNQLDVFGLHDCHCNRRKSEFVFTGECQFVHPRWKVKSTQTEAPSFLDLLSKNCCGRQRYQVQTFIRAICCADGLFEMHFLWCK